MSPELTRGTGLNTDGPYGAAQLGASMGLNGAPIERPGNISRKTSGTPQPVPSRRLVIAHQPASRVSLTWERRGDRTFPPEKWTFIRLNSPQESASRTED